MPQADLAQLPPLLLPAPRRIEQVGGAPVTMPSLVLVEGGDPGIVDQCLGHLVAWRSVASGESPWLDCQVDASLGGREQVGPALDRERIRARHREVAAGLVQLRQRVRLKLDASALLGDEQPPGFVADSSSLGSVEFGQRYLDAVTADETAALVRQAQCWRGAYGPVRLRSTILGQMVTARPCMACGGLGQQITNPCPDCRGEGRRTEEKTYTVDIPAGVDDGNTLQLGGRGAAGPRGGRPGDLFVHLRVKPDERFHRQGNDLVHVLHLPMTQAALGAHLRYETLDGTEDLVIPRGTQPGKVFRLRGRGVPDVNGRGRGDLLVQVVVDTPTELTKEQEDLLRLFAGARGEDVAPAESGFFAKVRSAFK